MITRWPDCCDWMRGIEFGREQLRAVGVQVTPGFLFGFKLWPSFQVKLWPHYCHLGSPISIREIRFKVQTRLIKWAHCELNIQCSCGQVRIEYSVYILIRWAHSTLNIQSSCGLVRLIGIGYYLEETIGSGGYSVDIHSVYERISLIEYWISPGWDHWIRWILNGYSFSVWMN